MLYRVLLALALLASGADAYMLAPLRPVAPMRAAVTVMGVKEAVSDCLESGCSLDDVEALIGELKTISSEQKDGTMDKAATMGMIVQLTELNKAPEENKNALEKLISGFGRSFGTVEAFDFPGEALGYTGKGGTTTVAGKALN